MLPGSIGRFSITINSCIKLRTTRQLPVFNLFSTVIEKSSLFHVPLTRSTTVTHLSILSLCQPASLAVPRLALRCATSFRNFLLYILRHATSRTVVAGRHIKNGKKSYHAVNVRVGKNIKQPAGRGEYSSDIYIYWVGPLCSSSRSPTLSYTTVSKEGGGVVCK